MATSVKETTLNIRGTEFQIRTDLAEEVLKRMAALVEGKMRDLDPGGHLPPAKVSLLASLTLAGELMDAQGMVGPDLSEVNTRMARLEALLDEALSTD